jgi:deoxyribodipyrimidine photolyase-related protein
LYWDFLARHQALLAKNPRMSLQVRNLARIAPEQLAAIGREATELRARLAESTPPSPATS